MTKKPFRLTTRVLSEKKREITLLLGLLTVVLAVAAVSFIFDIQIKPSHQFMALLRQLNITQIPLPEPETDLLYSQVAPVEGYTANIRWGDTGTELVKAEAIDMTKFRENYSDEQSQELLKFLTQSQDKGITITKDNAYFWLNTLWALGLAQKSDVLGKGVMGTKYKDEIGNFASTGGWTLGAKDPTILYNSSEIVLLTKKQQAMVDKISQGIYRPCCSNPSSFPDCNHGIAILGLVELMVSQGFSEKEVYEAALAFNSYWFTQNYVDLAYYFQTKENTLWQDVDPRRVLSAKFSSASGYQAIKKQIKELPSPSGSGGSCGA